VRLPSILRQLPACATPDASSLTLQRTRRVWVLELIPSFALYRGLYEFAQYAFLHGYGVRSTVAASQLWSHGVVGFQASSTCVA